jgi:small subunit ribosomal protein S26e
MIENSSKDDIAKVSVKEVMVIPKLYMKLAYCISCAIHNRIVAVRSREDRRIRKINREKKPDQVIN